MDDSPQIKNILDFKLSSCLLTVNQKSAWSKNVDILNFFKLRWPNLYKKTHIVLVSFWNCSLQALFYTLRLWYLNSVHWCRVGRRDTCLFLKDFSRHPLVVFSARFSLLLTCKWLMIHVVLILIYSTSGGFILSFPSVVTRNVLICYDVVEGGRVFAA